MDLNQYIQDAIKTESPIDLLEVPHDTLVNVLTTLIAAGNLLDVIKKDAFYGMPTTPEKIAARNKRITDNQQVLATHRTYDFNESKSTIPNSVVNPRMVHSLIGVTTESIELMEALHRTLTKNEPLDYVNIGEEFGDQDWYKGIGIDEMKADWGQILTANIEKLKLRYPNAFSSDSAHNRNVVNEYATLDSVLTIPPLRSRTISSDDIAR